MIKSLKNIIQKPFRVISNHKGQAAIVLILVVAVALVFYAISLNFGRLSQGKTLTTMSADAGASQLASGMAGYGQMLSEKQLHGKRKECYSTNVLVALITLVIVVVVTVLSGGLAGPYAALIAFSILAIAVGAIMQATIIQPGITDLWNRVKQKTMSTRDQLIENAIQGGLQKIVSDPVSVPDVLDMDGDRIWEPFTGGGGAFLDPADKISRFAFYNNERIQTINGGGVADLQNFVNALRQFLYKENALDAWGIHDDSTFACSSAECEPCCVPNAGTFYGTAFTGSRPETCGDSTNDVFWKGFCEGRSPYNDPLFGVPTIYPWAYQRYPENPGNAVISFREGIGRDDEHQLFEKKEPNPNGVQTQTLLSPPPSPPLPWNFLLKDATSYYVNQPYYSAPPDNLAPPFAATTDNRKGIFPFFYKAADWGIDLKKLNPATSSAHCYWKDDTYEPVPECVGVLLPPELQTLNLSLPINPAALNQNKTWYVDGDNNRTGTLSPPLNPGDPPLAVDKITFPDNIVEDDKDALGNPEPKCAQKALEGSSGFWKKGADRYCSDDPANEWPYASQCPKHGPGCVSSDGTTLEDCLCGEGGALGAEHFPDDVLDDIVYGLPDFIDWAKETLGQPIAELKTNMTTWYPSAAAWIEPGKDNGPWGSNAVSGVDCFTCNPTDGGLVIWLKEINMMIDRLKAWKDNTSYAAGGCNEVWCVPDSTCAGGADSSLLGGLGPEAATFNDLDLDGTKGDVDDVIACLKWNVEDKVTTTDIVVADRVSATGNAEKFQKCYDACDNVRNDVALMTNAAHANELCNVLPRSLVPGFDPDPASFEDLDLVNLNCGATCGGCVGPLCSCGACLCSDGPCLAIQTLDAKGSCADAAYMTDLQNSAKEAQNQVAKFNQRKVFLKNRVAEVNSILNDVLIPARDQFSAFLTGPAKALIQYRINYKTEEEGLPYQAIYGWQDDPPPGGGAGRWHIVKVDARIPEKCDNLCGTGGGNDLGWPRIKTYTKGWANTTRCFELVNTEGMVKFRTTRFDEGANASSLLFPGGGDIWKFRRTHPERVYDPNLLVGLENFCIGGGGGGGGVVQTLPDGTPTGIYQRAFMINKKVAGINDICWDRLHSLLANGVSSEACAQYYWHEGRNQGMGFKFVDCANF